MSIFRDCKALTSVTLPDGVTGLGKETFYNCSSLQLLWLPESITSIGENTFYGCSSLETLWVPISWKETSILENANLPSGCTVLYYDPSPPTVETTSTPVSVPFSWLEESAADILAQYTNDYEMAANAPAANGRPVWECYVADISPTDADTDFKVSFALENGQWILKPVPNHTPDRVYIVEGSDRLTPDAIWGPTTASNRFFRVRVELPPQE